MVVRRFSAALAVRVFGLEPGFNPAALPQRRFCSKPRRFRQLPNWASFSEPKQPKAKYVGYESV